MQFLCGVTRCIAGFSGQEKGTLNAGVGHLSRRYMYGPLNRKKVACKLVTDVQPTYKHIYWLGSHVLETIFVQGQINVVLIFSLEKYELLLLQPLTVPSTYKKFSRYLNLPAFDNNL